MTLRPKPEFFGTSGGFKRVNGGNLNARAG